MLVNEDIIAGLCSDAGDTRYLKSIKYVRQGKIEITKTIYENENNFEIHGKAYGTDEYDTYIEVKNGEIETIECTCPDYYNTYGVCKHSLATILSFQFQQNEEAENKILTNTISSKSKNKYNNFKEIVKTLYNEELDEIDSDLDIELKNKGTIKIEPKIIYDKYSREMKIEFKIGNKRMYKLKSLSEFYTRMINNEFYRYGDKLEFIHKKEMFEENSQGLLEFLMKYSEIIAFTNSNANSNYKYYGNALNDTNIIIGNSGIDELFDILKDKKVLIERDYYKQDIKF